MSNAPISMKVATTLTAYRIVKMSAANTVAYSTAATDKHIGVTRDDVKDTNQAIPVGISGRQKVQFNDTCAVGGFVTADASGFAVPVSVTTAGVYAIGQLVDAAVSATGTIAEILIQPMQLQIP